MSFSDAHPHQCPKLQFYHQQSQTRMIKCSRSEMVSDVLFHLFPYEKVDITKQDRKNNIASLIEPFTCFQ